MKRFVFDTRTVYTQKKLRVFPHSKGVFYFLICISAEMRFGLQLLTTQNFLYAYRLQAKKKRSGPDIKPEYRLELENANSAELSSPMGWSWDCHRRQWQKRSLQNRDRCKTWYKSLSRCLKIQRPDSYCWLYRCECGQTWRLSSGLARMQVSGPKRE